MFIPLGLYLKAITIFDCLKVSTCKSFVSKQGRKIDYEPLARGDLQEIRHLFARVVFDTVYPLIRNREKTDVGTHIPSKGNSRMKIGMEMW